MCRTLCHVLVLKIGDYRKIDGKSTFEGEQNMLLCFLLFSEILKILILVFLFELHCFCYFVFEYMDLIQGNYTSKTSTGSKNRGCNGTKHEDEDNSDYRNVRPLRIKSGWSSRLDELERQPQELIEILLNLRAMVS
uniref:Uncharacterized protein n=1 Tax=Davidia involucrata TaxID=16924 RepID=A0A5B7CBI6_DAVIN